VAGAGAAEPDLSGPIAGALTDKKPCPVDLRDHPDFGPKPGAFPGEPARGRSPRTAGTGLSRRTRRASRENVCLFLGSVSWGRDPLEITRLSGCAFDGFPLTPRAVADPNFNQRITAETASVDVLGLTFLYQNPDFHILAGFGLGAGRQVIDQKLGSPSILLGPLEGEIRSRANTGGGFSWHGKIEFAHTNPFVSLGVLCVLGMLALDVACEGKLDWGGLLDGLLGGIRQSGKGKGLRIGTDDACMMFGLSADFRYMRLTMEEESLFGRTLCGTWRFLRPTYGIFTGMYFGRAAILKLGGEFVEVSVNAHLGERAPRPESWRLDAHRWTFAGIAELILMRMGPLAFNLKASTLGGGTYSASLGLSLA
jgi:hypothetical protein